MPRIRRDMRLPPTLSGSTLVMSHRHRAFSPRFVPLLQVTAAVLAVTVVLPPDFQPDQRIWAQSSPPAVDGHADIQPPLRPATDDLAALAGPNRDFPWWPWILAFPALGGLLWWLLRETSPTATPLALGTVGTLQPERLSEATSPGERARAADGRREETSGHEAADSDRGADQAPIQTAPDQPAPERRIILIPRSSHAAYVYWELPPSEVEALQRRNYGLCLKVHDVTDIEQVDQHPPHATEIVPCATTAMGDHHLPMAQPDRDYLAELGYRDDTSTWHALVRSEPVRFPAQPHRAEPQLAAIARPAPERSPTATPAPETAPSHRLSGLDTEPSRVVDAAIPRPGTAAARASLMAQNGQSALARWEIPPDQVADLKTGKRRLTVRLYDVTELPGFLASTPNSVQEFEAELAPQAERMLPIAVEDRDYLIEVGYMDGRGQWHVLAKSSPVRVPAC